MIDSTSFSKDIKEELCRHPVKKSCCALAECYGALLLCHTFSPTEIRFLTSYKPFTERLANLLYFVFGVEPDIKQGKGGRYTVLISSQNDIAKILTKCGYDDSGFLSLSLNGWLYEKDCCRSAFMRGLFLSGGSISSPDKKCHLEFTSTHSALCRELVVFFSDSGLKLGLSVRGNNNVLYMKTGENIEDFLTMCGAPLSAMKLMEAKLVKEIRNRINRQNNFECANGDKAIDASVIQRFAIEKLSSTGVLYTLDGNLQETAKLRLENPSASLAELALLAGTSRSGLYHRLRKLCELADGKSN